MFCFQIALPMKHGKRSRDFVLLTSSLKTHGTNVYLKESREIATHPKKAEFSRSSKALAK